MDAAIPPATGAPSIDELAGRTGIRRVRFITWRDLDHPEAGGSEIHATHIAARWAAAGLDVEVATGAVPGSPPLQERDGYRVVRRGGRLTVLAHPLIEELRGARRRRDALVEVWHGVNFLAPVWAGGPRIAIAHHVHGGQFRHVLPGPAATVAGRLERHVYPRLYRSTPLVTLSESARRELLALGHSDVTVISPGVDARFQPGGTRAPDPTIVTVARLMPQKRVGAVVDALATVRRQVPAARLEIVGDGPLRGALESQVRAQGLAGAVTFHGRLGDAELVAAYQRAWVVASASEFEGWGMTLTEAAACATPAVASAISGHRDAVVHDRTGLLAGSDEALAAGLIRILTDHDLRRRLGAAARERASARTWAGVARSVFAVLAADAERRSGPR